MAVRVVRMVELFCALVRSAGGIDLTAGDARGSARLAGT
jgi:hypothetical protein